MCGPTTDIQQVDVARLTWDDMNNNTETIVPIDTQPRVEGCLSEERIISCMIDFPTLSYI